MKSILMTVMLLMSQTIFAQMNPNSVQIDLSAVGTKMNTCLVEKVRGQLGIPANAIVLETGFAFYGNFSTHPLFNQVPVLFISELAATGTPDTYNVKQDIHLALISELRTWSPVKTPGTDSITAIKGLNVSETAYLAIRPQGAFFFNSQLLTVNIKDCLN